MRTHVDLDEALLAQVVQLGRFPTKKAAIQAALAEFVQTLKPRELLRLRGQVPWEGDLTGFVLQRAIENAASTL